jgi:DNA polymerase-3 subunit gamma/tau
MSSLHEQYRPRSWDELVGQVAVKKLLDKLRPRGLAGRAYWISGPSGSGKTTIARLLAVEVAHPCLTDEIDGTSVSAGYLDDVERMLRFKPLFGSAYAWIVNEAHRIRADLVTRLLVLLDPVPAHAIYVFTTTSEAQAELWDRKLDSAPFLSRCVKLKTKPSALDFAIRCKQIAEREGLNGKSLGAYQALARDCSANMRAMLQSVENGQMLG